MFDCNVSIKDTVGKCKTLVIVKIIFAIKKETFTLF